MIYLDTHVLIWLFDNDLNLFTPRGIQHIEDHTLRVSPMVRLELQYLYKLGKISTPASEILLSLMRKIGIRECELPFGDVVTEAMNLNWTRDPFDRLIVAQSILGSGQLLTKDRHLLQNAPNTFW